MPKGGGNGAEGAFAAHLNLTGESAVIDDLPDIAQWQFAVLDRQDTMPLYHLHAVGLFREDASIRVADFHKMIHGTSILTATLELEVRAVQVR